MEKHKANMAFDLFLNNFRSFREDTFKFSKINILIGENSSGKSSLFKFFLSLKQTLEHPNDKETNFAFSGAYTDLGSYKESIYYHNDDLPLEFSFNFGSDYYDFFESLFTIIENEGNEDAEKKIKLQQLIDGPIVTPTKIKISLSKELDKHHSITTEIVNEAIGSLTVKQLNEKNIPKNLLRGSTCELIFRNYQTNDELIVKDVSFEKVGFTSLISGNSLHDSLRDIFDASDNVFTKEELTTEEKLKKARVEINYTKIAFLLVAQNYLNLHAAKMDYINPIDTRPTRVFYDKDRKLNPKIQNLEDVVNFIGRDDNISKSTLKQFIKIVKFFGIADGIEVVRDDRLPVRELRVKVKDLLSNITDVGYGVSLQLPLILKSLLADNLEERHNSILLIEQPEVHLHPMLHAKLIETLVSLSEHTTYFVETHSEHIVRKLQVLVKEGKYGLLPDDVSIHYFKRIKKKTEVTHHRINSSGMLEPSFPTGFFDNSYLLSKQLLD